MSGFLWTVAGIAALVFAAGWRFFNAPDSAPTAGEAPFGHEA